MSTIRCAACGALNHYNTPSCERCGQSLSDERNAAHAARRAQESAEPPFSQDARFSSRAPRDFDEGSFTAPAPMPAASSRPSLNEDGQLLPVEGIKIKPDPWIGPILRRFTEYTLARDAIKVRTGVLNRQLRQVELWRVASRGPNDVYATSGFIGTFFKKTANIHILSSDTDTPHLVLRDVHNAERIVDLIRRSAAAEQMRRNRWMAGGMGYDGDLG